MRVNWAEAHLSVYMAGSSTAFRISSPPPVVGYLPTCSSVLDNGPWFAMIHLPDPTLQLSRPTASVSVLQGKDTAMAFDKARDRLSAHYGPWLICNSNIWEPRHKEALLGFNRAQLGDNYRAGKHLIPTASLSLRGAVNDIE